MLNQDTISFSSGTNSVVNSFNQTLQQVHASNSSDKTSVSPVSTRDAFESTQNDLAPSLSDTYGDMSFLNQILGASLGPWSMLEIPLPHLDLIITLNTNGSTLAERHSRAENIKSAFNSVYSD